MSGLGEELLRGSRVRVRHLRLDKLQATTKVQHRYSRFEVFVVLGSGTMEVGKDRIILTEGRTESIDYGKAFEIRALGMEPLEVLLLQYGSYLEDDDCRSPMKANGHASLPDHAPTPAALPYE